MILVSYSKNLRSPMYFFLSQLSLCDILLSIDSVPNTLNVIINEGGTMYLAGCIIQYIIFLMSESSECLLLTVMSYDRYLAICSPLHYGSIMGDTFCKKLSVVCWTPSFIYSLILSASLSSLYFCGPNTIDHFFCDLDPILKLSCSDVSFIHVEAKVLSVPAVVCPFLIIMASYICIVNAVLNISSFSGRQKAFFTCSSHLTVVCLYYGTVIAVYMLPTSLHTLNMNKIFTMIYAVFTPSLNPIIYSLRNKDIWEAMEIFLNKITCCLGMRSRFTATIGSGHILYVRGLHTRRNNVGISHNKHNVLPGL
ncbi:PREDICTED: olfactory receptor 5V1-like [Nanorana parkeri]|uniref:olfactory receptor 5V1-like n=1 Tax=Nanorana parkeri TaxID=125878 RepID=UPI0008545575|nr:PREDICTED: olfactory receptor 5V1-like [Nanorana parkeri]